MIRIISQKVPETNQRVLETNQQTYPNPNPNQNRIPPGMNQQDMDEVTWMARNPGKTRRDYRAQMSMVPALRNVKNRAQRWYRDIRPPD